ncbi:amidase family protein [Nocardioides sp.]|uniref:amidase family protein n=1 Tax=Nocardioides sp. TaxID=35761 RepID=UPI0039E4950E
MAQVDVLLTPTTPRDALPPANVQRIQRFFPLTATVNALGWPAISVPMGPSSQGLPPGLRLIGKPGADRLVLGVAHPFQTLTDWHLMQAPLVSSVL